MGYYVPSRWGDKVRVEAPSNMDGSPGARITRPLVTAKSPRRSLLGGPLSPLRRTGGQDVTGWPANPKLVRHLKSTLIRTGVHVDEAVMGLSVHTDEDGGGDNPLLRILINTMVTLHCMSQASTSSWAPHRRRCTSSTKAC